MNQPETIENCRILIAELRQEIQLLKRALEVYDRTPPMTAAEFVELARKELEDAANES